MLHPQRRCYTGLVPTTRPRHTVTESDEITRALQQAAERWPEHGGAPGRLLLELIREGQRVIEENRRDEVEARREAVRRTAGALTGVYPPGYLERLREEWPE